MMEDELLRDQAVNMDVSHDNDGQEGREDVAASPRTSSRAEESEADRDFDALVEFETLRKQAIRATSGFETINQGEVGIALTEIPGYRWSDAATRRGIRLPGRIDLDEKHVEVLIPYITFQREVRKHEHFERLELSWAAGQGLVRDVRRLLNEAENATFLNSRREAGAADGKRALLGLAFRFLKGKSLGPKYFGAANKAARKRKLCWPAHSTLLLCHFSVFLNKQIDLEKMKLRTRMKQTSSQGALHGNSWACPIDLSDDNNTLHPSLVPIQQPAAILSIPSSGTSKQPHASYQGPLTPQSMIGSPGLSALDYTRISPAAVHLPQGSNGPRQSSNSTPAIQDLPALGGHFGPTLANTPDTNTEVWHRFPPETGMAIDTAKTSANMVV